MSKGSFDGLLVGLLENELGQWFSKCHARITWEFARNADSQPCPRPTKSECLGRGPTTCALTNLPANSHAHPGLQPTTLNQSLACFTASNDCKAPVLANETYGEVFLGVLVGERLLS